MKFNFPFGIGYNAGFPGKKSFTAKVYTCEI